MGDYFYSCAILVKFKKSPRTVALLILPLSISSNILKDAYELFVMINSKMIY